MLGFPPSTEFNKRIPKQKFYENAAVPAAVKRLFADQLRCIYWRNKLAVSTLNLTAGERVTEIEIFELCLTCLLYTSPSPRDGLLSRMPSSA